MLKHLTIKNYALIKHLELEPSAHLNVITGETGAGKSIMLGALGLLMGNRADTKVLWDENEKCVTEGVFDIKAYRLKSFFKSEDLDYDDLTVIRREISPGGKSRAFINDTPVTLEVMKKVGALLMDIHSQHETLQLGNHIFQLHLVDAFAENQSLKESYGEAWQLYVKAKKSYEDLVSQAESLRQEADYVRFQLDELMKAELQEQEQESLESELKVMEHAEEIKNRFQSILQALSESDYASLHSVREAVANLQHISGFSPLYEVLHKRLDSVLIELSDIVDEISKAETDIEFDPERTEFVKERLSLLYRLMKKHRMNTVGELITLQESLQQKDAITSNVDEALAQAKSMFTAAETRVSTAAKSLSESRKKVFQPLCLQLTKLLKDLGIPDATMVIENQPTEPSAYGIDRLEILFSANKGIAPRPLAQVASGGEFSRVMFSIKYIMTEKTAMPTLILDEIDSGVSGEVAMMLGNMMKRMSKKHQIISITHLPQIAAKGNAHYFVFKDNSSNKTISSVKQLQDHERVEEIAKMIGGAKPSKIALENAQELLAQ
jgi:DNA repair protein RecN (Recombination protein N)